MAWSGKWRAAWASAWLVGLLALLGVVGGVAWAQSGGDGERERERVARDPGPILTLDRHNRNHWTLRYRINLSGIQVSSPTDPRQRGTTRVQVDKAALVFPVLVDGTGMSETWADEVTGFVRWGRNTVDRPARRVKGYQGPTELLVYEAANINTTHLEFEVEIPVTSYETRIDEARAFAVDWPRGEWAPEILQNLDSQLFIETGHPDIARLVEAWTNGQPRRARPYMLAKILAGKVVEYYQPSGGTLEGERVGFNTRPDAVLTSGFRVFGAAEAAREGIGPPLDMANLLTAVYRTAGLPARTVIGLELRRPEEDRADPDRPRIRAWTEFYLYDEQFDRGEWIPVDILQQRAFSNRAPALDRRWQYFGHNEDFDYVVPIAFHWHPPTVVVNSGPPALWGWVTEPDPPEASQEVRVNAFGTPLDAERQRKRLESERLRQQGQRQERAVPPRRR
ncbi:MAG: transglutaminase domain-containing protein [Phycisphaeraceae bacterium]|nr:MAG: transglutaminase domain-containing protein [Phycisphaeraceae bacterium]